MPSPPFFAPLTFGLWHFPLYHQSCIKPWLERFAENAMSSVVLAGKKGNAMSSDVLIRNSESFALLATLMIIMLLPEVTHHGMK